MDADEANRHLTASEESRIESGKHGSEPAARIPLKVPAIVLFSPAEPTVPLAIPAVSQ